MEQYHQQMPISSSNVLLCMIDEVAYTPTVEALHTIFSTYGYVQKITVFEKNGKWQALVQYPDDGTAAMAKQVLHGHNMYPGGKNKLTLEFSNHRDLQIWANDDRNWDFLMAPGGPAAAKAAADAAKAAQKAHAAASASSRPAGAGAAGAAVGERDSSSAAAGHAADADGNKQQNAAGDDSSSGGERQHDPNAPLTGADWVHAHNEATRLAIEALGESLAGLPGSSSGPRTMVPHPPRDRGGPGPAGSYGGATLHGGYGPPSDPYAAGGYGYAQPPPGYGPPPPVYGYGPGYGY